MWPRGKRGVDASAPARGRAKRTRSERSGTSDADAAFGAFRTWLRQTGFWWDDKELDLRASGTISAGGVGYSCLAEIRMIETIENGKPETTFMQFGDRIEIEMNDSNGNSIFGTIDQVVERYEGPQGVTD